MNRTRLHNGFESVVLFWFFFWQDLVPVFERLVALGMAPPKDRAWERDRVWWESWEWSLLGGSGLGSKNPGWGCSNLTLRIRALKQTGFASGPGPMEPTPAMESPIYLGQISC